MSLRRSAGPEQDMSEVSPAPTAYLLEDDLPPRKVLVRVWAVVAGFFLVAVVGSIDVGIPFRDPHGDVFLSRVAISLTLFTLLALLHASWRVRSHWSMKAVRRVLSQTWTIPRLTVAIGGILAYYSVYFTYHNLKSWNAFNAPRDQMLLQWDKWLFLGHDPAVLLHDLLGRGAATYVLMFIYESFSTIVLVSVAAAMVLPRRQRESYVFVASAMWVWILGTASYYAIPSLGPFDAEPSVFAQLPRTMINDTQARYMGERANLLAHPHADHAFAQVAAFASLHVAVSTFLLLMAYFYRLRRITIFMSVFVFCTCIATVYLGWHFFVDDIAGLLIAWVSVRLGRWMNGAGKRALEPVLLPSIPAPTQASPPS